MNRLNSTKRVLLPLFVASSLLCGASLQGCVSNYAFAPEPDSAASSGNSGGPVTPNPAPVQTTSPPAGSGAGGTSSGGTSSTCTPQQAQNLRVLFMVDASGSTQSDDPDAKVRTQSALNFLNQNSSLNNLSYSYSYFAAEEPSYDFSTLKFTENPSLPFGNASETVQAVDLFAATYESVQLNGTDYEDALSALGNLVSADNNANPDTYSYAVVFMSDGEPNRGPDTSSAIDPLVTDLINTVGSKRMTLSAVYFSNSPDSTDEGVIDNMAITGAGQYVNGDSQNLDLQSMIQSIVTVPIAACPGT